jgi:hypothetical protein
VNIAVDGNSFFHTGWLACMLGLPRGLPGAVACRQNEVDCFLDGWDTCSVTPAYARMEAYYRMQELGQAVACWVDDQNDEIQGPQEPPFMPA